MLLPQHLQYLSERAVSAEAARAGGLRSVTADEASALVGVTVTSGGIAIPYPNLVEPYTRIRLDTGEQRFTAPAGRPVPIYLPPAVVAQERIVVVEGPIKALALNAAGIPAIGLGGTGTTLAPAEAGRGLNDSWAPIAKVARSVVVCFDSDRCANPAVGRDEARLVRALTAASLGALVANLPCSTRGKWGPDDFLATHGAAALQAVLDEAVPGDPVARVAAAMRNGSVAESLAALLEDLPFLSSVVELGHAASHKVEQAFRQHTGLPGRLRTALREARAQLAQCGSGSRDFGSEYVVENGKHCVVQTNQDRALVTPLCNFVAEIETERIVDDGAEKRRVFVLSGQLEDGTPLPQVNVNPEKFDRGNWPLDAWGASAIVAGTRGASDHLRVAIQRGSTPVVEVVYTRTGWIRESGSNIFLYAGGAVGGDKAASLEGPLARYTLPDSVDDAKAAWKSALSTLNIAPVHITVPLLLAVARAPLCVVAPVDFVLHLFGTTGTFKSSLAAVFLSFFGKFSHDSLPASFADTINSLEGKANVLHDVVMVADEFVPSPDPRDPVRQKGDNLLRMVGNGAPRGRLRADLSARPPRPPSGLIITTGEDLFANESVTARALCIGITKGDVDRSRLSTAQRIGPTLATATRSYIEWLAPRLGLVDVSASTRLPELRTIFQSEGGHGRAASAAAHLMFAGEVLLAFFVDTAIMTAAEADATLKGWRTAMLVALQAQKPAGASSNPGKRFVEVLCALLDSGRVSLASPEQGLAAGAVGWVKGQEVWLDQILAYNAVQQFLRLEGGSLTLTQRALWQRLRDDGVLVTQDAGHHTAQRLVQSKKRRVLVLHAAVFGIFPRSPSISAPIPPGLRVPQDLISGQNKGLS